MPTHAYMLPFQRPQAGFEAYLPDEGYYVDDKQFPLEHLARVTVEAVMQYADRFFAFQTFHRAEEREGPVPRDSSAARALVQELFSWFDQRPDGEGWSPELALIRDRDEQELWVLNAHDGFPGPLMLRPEWFMDVQSALRQAGLPPDLYYPLAQQRRVVEPIQPHGGGVVLTEVTYSRKRWKARSGGTALTVPSEDERRQAFSRRGRA